MPYVDYAKDISTAMPAKQVVASNAPVFCVLSNTLSKTFLVHLLFR